MFLITEGSASWKISEQPLTVNSQDVNQAANNPITSYSNIAYTLRFYAGTHFQSLRGKANYVIGKGIPLFITEMGFVNADSNGALITIPPMNGLIGRTRTICHGPTGQSMTRRKAPVFSIRMGVSQQQVTI
ncbi:glycoside hydrolase family 5 protein [Paenibacillus peoriae]|uniref:glycoside hydrolase family 5 protein n=1 Tax=Paenibacillus peoriae TaxID=59893 RepID=UPI00215A3D55|nr:glycoside hydrolase family 5 protein [Paenibacillus peoriae]